ncbi:MULTISPECIES: hypothetical protein [unclassified Vibrio]|uniref:hypothetical protein n=1 Tax=unclassified Vibrio TaxID=2614977 RepID=UPI00207507D8|nr:MULTISPECIES: hypothetical protein [unclassified Vibrio]MDK9779236.1 hypothetical protein [Vibrio sp. D401a]MDK9809193.1 hypothetical protein [Vibrio sp. D406a]USD48765.1 hypothetical protein J4N37_09000 [Vibrio sp. SCSIO 43153]USD48802.1 hypothetical protein J4N37_09230 [Vibrio sp. SCSIO 43153]
MDAKNIERIQAFHLLACYMYSFTIIKLYDVDYGLYSLVYASIFNLIALEYYWSKYHHLVGGIKKTITYSLAKYFFPLLVIAFCAYSSSMILEEITKVPSSTMAHHVSIYSFGLFLLISLISMLFIIELAVPIIMLKDIITINGKEHMTENIMIVLVMTMAPALIVTKLAQGNLFNAKFISSMLYESYHSNENAECPNVSVDSRFHWISTSEVSTVKYNKEAGTYIFGKDEC